MGLAIGCFGMSMADFCNCDFDEFESISKSWHEMTEYREREEWERMRILAAICIQPHTKKRITPKQLIRMPWDHEKPKRNAPEISLEQQRKRFEKIKNHLHDQ